MLLVLERTNVGSSGYVQDGEQGYASREGAHSRFHGGVTGQPVSTSRQHSDDKTVGGSGECDATGRHVRDHDGRNSFPDELQQRRMEEDKEVQTYREYSGPIACKHGDTSDCLIKVETCDIMRFQILVDTIILTMDLSDLTSELCLVEYYYPYIMLFASYRILFEFMTCIGNNNNKRQEDVHQKSI